MKSLVILGMLLAGGAAYADETNCQTYGHDTHCTTTKAPTDNFDWSWAHEAGKKDFERAGQNLYNAGVIATTPAPTPKVDYAVLVINCGKPSKLVRTFTDGHVDQVDMGIINPTDADLANLQIAYPGLKIARACQ